MHFRNTRIYSKMLELTRIARRIESQLPKGYAFLVDQLRRASSSVVLNFAEAHGRTSQRERRRFFQIAAASAHEVAAIAEVANCYGVIDAKLHEDTVDLTDHLAAMLWKYR